MSERDEKKRDGTRYKHDPVWADVVPLPPDDGFPNALATIAYTEEYAEASAYLRAVMAANEFSQRALDLTAHLIKLNPAHYTVWLYRAKILENIPTDMRDELEWLDEICLKNIKNYQMWHHRQMVLNRLYEQEGDKAWAGEAEFLEKMLAKDTKNYHVWGYRQWLVRRFGLWDEGELEDVEEQLRFDIRNNSAWNHRWFLVFGRENEGVEVTEQLWQREFAFAKDAIMLTPQNESPWNYFRALLRKQKKPASSEVEFVKRFAPLDDNEDIVRSSYALDMLAEAYGEKQATAVDAKRALELLATKYDPIRANYWRYREELLPVHETAV